VAGLAHQLGQPRSLPADHDDAVPGTQVALDFGEDGAHLPAVARPAGEMVCQPGRRLVDYGRRVVAVAVRRVEQLRAEAEGGPGGQSLV